MKALEHTEAEIDVLMERLNKEKGGDIYRSEATQMERLMGTIAKKKDELVVLAESAKKGDDNQLIFDRIIALTEKLDEDLIRLQRCIKDVLERPRGQRPRLKT